MNEAIMDYIVKNKWELIVKVISMNDGFAKNGMVLDMHHDCFNNGFNRTDQWKQMKFFAHLFLELNFSNEVNE